MGIERADPSKIEVMTPLGFIARSADGLIARLESEGIGEDSELLQGLKAWRARQTEVPQTLPEVVQLVTYQPDDGQVADDKEAK